MKNQARMNVISEIILKRVIIILYIIFPLVASCQNTSYYFFAEPKNDQYELYTDGDLYLPSNLMDVDNIYIDFKNATNNEVDGILFKVVSCEQLKSVDSLPEKRYVDFSWIKKKERIKTEKSIELNNFKDLNIVLSSENSHYIYKVVRQFTSN